MKWQCSKLNFNYCLRHSNVMATPPKKQNTFINVFWQSIFDVCWSKFSALVHLSGDYQSFHGVVHNFWSISFTYLWRLSKFSLSGTWFLISASCSGLGMTFGSRVSPVRWSTMLPAGSMLNPKKVIEWRSELKKA